MHPLKVAARAQVPPFYVMDVLAAANARQRAHGDVVSFAAGQPATGAPAAVRAAVADAVSADPGYTESLGLPALRAAIAGHYDRWYGTHVDPADVVVTTGSSGGFLLAFLAAFDAGDRVALTRPGYPAYRNILTALGCEVVDLPTLRPTPADLAAAGPLAGVVVASPANPTGTVLAPEELADLAAWCTANGTRLVSDEIYHGISYGARTATAWATTRESIVVNSFSKYWGMTGWRLGWLLVPQQLRYAVECLTANFTICPPTLSQQAAVAAFAEETYAEQDAHVARYAVNRQVLLSGLAALGITRVAPADGAFYAYADVAHLTDDSMSFCHRLLADTGVAVVPGVDFDPVDGRRWIRFSFAGSTEDVREGLRRLGPWLGTNAPARPLEG
ncbi:aminotransferase class I/II-fold pyridoxal phosphate-dependent enzyme [Actinokineospora bangkokensis]|uniref:Aminotransferase n=1 Tax=Actinokineospora bangkokensis TaxID=1193682 RepID=A0A1Q9LFV2_9PSEU|nr:aminotransferase class I/II-fold pyridoxal phosphate-dependent enzyme [Actinokineospora bangkokensis]OLR90900.1 aspartate aminotransferase [Actinokineospora bangkokensis]